MAIASQAAGCAAAPKPPSGQDDAARAALESENERLRERVATLEKEQLELRAARDKAAETAGDPRPASVLEAESSAVTERADEEPSAAEPDTRAPEVATASLAGGRELRVVRLTPSGQAQAPLAASGRPVIRASGKGATLSDPTTVSAAAGEPAAPIQISGDAAAPHYDRAVVAFEQGAWAEAVREFSRFLSTSPSHPYADNALLHRGQCRRELNQLSLAEADLRAFVERYPDEHDAPDAWLALGAVREQRGDQTAAAAAYRALATRFPDSQAASQIPPRFQP